MSMQRRQGRKKNFRRKKRGGKGQKFDKTDKFDTKFLNAGACRIKAKFRAYPDSFLVNMRYSDPQGNLTNVGSTFSSARYRMNSVWDPDPSLGGGTVDGYTFYASVYGRYRVIGLKFNVSCDNNDTFAKRLIVWPSQTDLGANYSGTDLASELPHARTILLGAKGSGNENRTLRGSYSLARLFGTEQYNASDSSGANYNGNPGIIMFLNVGTSAASNFVSGANVSIILTYQTLWYTRETVANYSLPEKELVEKYLNLQHGHGPVTNKELEAIIANKLLCDKLEDFKKLQTMSLVGPPPILLHENTSSYVIGGLSPLVEDFRRLNVTHTTSSPPPMTPTHY